MLTAAVIGCGRMGTGDSSRLSATTHQSLLPVGHAEAFLSRPGYELVAVCDPDIARASEAGRGYGVRAFEDVSALINQARPDVVSIATRTDVRIDILKALCQSGSVSGIYAEKPFARSLCECQEGIREVRQSDTKLVLGTSRRYQDVYRYALSHLDSGNYGAMLGLRIGIKEGALLMWTLPHFIDLMIAFMLGRKLVEISANCNVRDLGETERMLDFDPIVTGAEVVFENGVSASFCESSDYSFDILCEEGEISASQGGPNQPPYISVRKLGEAPTRTIVEGQRSGIERALDELEEAVCSRPNCLAGLDELKLQQLILSGIAYSGLCGGAVVEIGQIPNDLVITGNSGGFVA